MKKSLSLLLACAMLVVAMPCALADGTTTLTTTVPASATYTLQTSPPTRPPPTPRFAHRPRGKRTVSSASRLAQWKGSWK